MKTRPSSEKSEFNTTSSSFTSTLGKTKRFFPQTSETKNNIINAPPTEDDLNSEDNLNDYDYDKEKEYYDIMKEEEKNSKPPRTLVKLTSDELMKEYATQVKYLKKYYLRAIIYSFLVLLKAILSNLIINNSQIYIVLIILTILSFSFTVIMCIFVYISLSLDKYSYIAYYIFGIIQSLTLLVLLIANIFGIFFEYEDLKEYGRCSNKEMFCSQFYKYLFLNGITLSSLVIMVFLIGFPISFLISSAKIIMGRKKTIAQKQMDINNTPFQKIEFAEEDKKD